MTEAEKLDAGLEYDFWDDEVNGRKLHAIEGCKELNAIDSTEEAAREEVIRRLFGTVGENPVVLPGFQCDDGTNIHVGKNFLANYNVTILDIAPVYIGDYCMIAPGTIIATVGHPFSPKKRRNHIGQAQPIHIGSDVWIGARSVILPGVTIGNNVVIAAGSVVTKDIPDNCLAGGVPAKKIRDLENDTEE